MRKETYELNQQVNGKPIMEFMTHLLEENEKQSIDVARLKGSVSVLKQINDRTKVVLGAHIHVLNKATLEFEKKKFELQK